MVRSMIDKHHGRIDVASTPGEGTVFTIYLPAEMDAEEQAAYLTDPSTTPISGGRILVVDDETIVQNILVEMLEICGYSVDTAATGEAGWEKYLAEQEAGHRYDLVIMDLTLPGGMGGKAAALKILEIDPDALIIAASGYSTDPIMANYHDYGFVGRLLKPFYLADLQKEVLRALTLNQ
jgi:CheY-like chemotaxis protein